MRRWLPVLAVVALAACGSDPAAKPTPAAWCGLDLGATAAQARAAMGTPAEDHTGSHRVAGFQPQLAWRSGPYAYTMFFNPVGHAQSLQVDDTALSAAERAAFPCALDRSVP